MTKPDDIPQDVWDTGVLLNKVASEVFTGSVDEASAFIERHVEAIARAIMAEREACEERTAELLLNPAAVYVNWLRGSIDARSIIADEREACAQVADTHAAMVSHPTSSATAEILAKMIRNRGA